MAVFLRTYLWNEFAVRSARLVLEQSADADFFVLADETRSGAIDTAPFRKVAHVAADFSKLDLPILAPRGEVLWWNCDYGFYDAYLKYPSYDYYFFVEDDVAVNLPLLLIAQQMAARALDCVTFAGHRVVDDQWGLHPFCRELPYQPKTWTPLTVTFVSGRAVRFLLAERQRLGMQFRLGLAKTWAFCEAFVSSALLAGGFNVDQLKNFANVDHFGANLSYLETDRRIRTLGSLAHAVLDKERFGPRFLNRSLDSLLRTGDYARLRDSRTQLLKAGFTTFEGFRVLPGTGNLALDKPATQSSISRWSRPPANGSLDPFTVDARGGNCGILTGTHGFHTDGGPNAWWSVDLEQVHDIGEVRIFNSPHVPERARRFSVQVSENGQSWDLVYHKDDDRVFFGPDDPLPCLLPEPVRARHVRVVLDSNGPLHLSQVEVYPPVSAKRAAIYLRVSTGEQTVENQRRDLQAAAAQRGWTITASYADEGISGSKGRDKQPGLDAMLKDATRGTFDVVMCWAVDRMGRSLGDLVGTLQELHGAKVDLFLHQQAIDTTTPAGRAMFGMLGVFAEFERSMIQAHVNTSQRSRPTEAHRHHRSSRIGRGR